MEKRLTINEPPGLDELFSMQIAFQKLVTGITGPIDDPKWFQYHVAAMQEELGEVLKADKRWKTHRNAHYDFENKLEEIADVFVTAMNMSIFSGIDSGMIAEAIRQKIIDNLAKLQKERAMNDSSR